MSANTSVTNALSINKMMENSSVRLLLISCFLGGLMGVVFILIQPMFGMDTLTSRHAGAYQKLGGLGAISAVTIAWVAHSAVSIFYGLLSGIVFLKTDKLAFVGLYVLLFTWITTVIAPPANALIVQLVSFQTVIVSKLPVLNFSLDVKFLLHLIFFAAISAALHVYKKKTTAM